MEQFSTCRLYIYLPDYSKEQFSRYRWTIYIYSSLPEYSTEFIEQFSTGRLKIYLLEYSTESI